MAAWIGSHPPTKTLPFHGGINPGRWIDVPAPLKFEPLTFKSVDRCAVFLTSVLIPSIWCFLRYSDDTLKNPQGILKINLLFLSQLSYLQCVFGLQESKLISFLSATWQDGRLLNSRTDLTTGHNNWTRCVCLVRWFPHFVSEKQKTSSPVCFVWFLWGPPYLLMATPGVLTYNHCIATVGLRWAAALQLLAEMTKHQAAAYLGRRCPGKKYRHLFRTTSGLDVFSTF